MKNQLLTVLLGLVLTAYGTNEFTVSSREPPIKNISVGSSYKMASIVGGYDAGTMGLPGYSSPEKLLSPSPRSRPELDFKNPITELVLDQTYDFGSHHHATGKTRESTDKADRRELFERAGNKFLGHSGKESLPEDNEVELLTDDSTVKKIKEGTVGTSYNVGSGDQGGSNVDTQTGLPEFPVGVGQERPEIGIPGLNQPGFLFRIPGFNAPESSPPGNPYGVPGTNTFGPDTPFVVPGIRPVNGPPGFAFKAPELPSSSSGQGSQFGDHGTTVILESGPIFIKEGSPRPVTYRPPGLKPQFDEEETDSSFDYVLSYG